MYRQYGFQVPRSGLARTAEEAANLCSDIGFPVVLKIVSPDILHKTDVGGVELGIASPVEARQAFERIVASAQAAHPQANIEGVEIQEMIDIDTEIIIGLLDDPQFGPVIMFGLGGIFTEILKDVVFRVLPIERNDAEEMIREIKGHKLLEGYRGRPPVSHDMLVDLLLNASRLGTDMAGKLESVDFNPIVVWEDQHRVLDAKIIWHAEERENPLVCSSPNTAHLGKYFKPNSVALVGASANPGKLSYVALDSLLNHGFQGKVYPINPRREQIMGLKAYPSISDVPETIDLAVAMVGLDLIPALIDECAANGVFNMIVITGGGKELGDRKMVDVENKIRQKSKERGVRVIGPNCLGIYDAWSKLDTIFLTHERVQRPHTGRVAILSQSGAMGLTFLEDAKNMGLSKCVSYGNRADVDEADLLAFLVDDPETDVIALYLEGLERGRRFMYAARDVSSVKPIVAYKVGRTEQAARASMSHTGFFGGSHGVVMGAFKQAGVIGVNSYEELRATCRMLAMQPPARGPRVGMISNGGGVLVQGVDLVNSYGLEMPQLDPETVRVLTEAYPPFYVIHNPIDLTGSASGRDFEIGIDALINDPNVDIVMVWLICQVPGISEEIIKIMSHLNEKSDKPIVVGSIGGPFTYDLTMRIVQEGIPVFRSIREWVVAAHGAAFSRHGA